MTVPALTAATAVDTSLHLHGDVLAVCVLLLGGYAYAAWRYGPLFHPRPDERAVRPGQAVAFGAGVVLLWVAAGSPLHDIGARSLFWVHSVEHLLYALAIPPLLLLGVPTWMGELVLRRLPGSRALRWLARPVPAALGFNAMLVLMHWPPVVELMVTSQPAHAGLHALMLAAGLLLWLPVLSPVPDIPRLSPPAQMFYLFLQTLLPTIPASFLTFAETPLYGIYAELPKLGGISALDDVRVAGLIVKIGGGLLLWTVIAVLFFRWASQQEAAERAGDAAGDPAPRRPTRRRS